MKLLQISDELAAEHYGEHEGKPFYPGLVAFITSGPVIAICLDGPYASSIARKVMGSTNPAEAAPGTVRGDLAIDAGRLTQGGGNVAPGRREIQADGQLVTPGVVDGHTHTTTDRSPGIRT